MTIKQDLKGLQKEFRDLGKKVEKLIMTIEKSEKAQPKKTITKRTKTNKAKPKTTTAKKTTKRKIVNKI